VLKFLKQPRLGSKKKELRFAKLEESFRIATSICPSECGILFQHLQASKKKPPRVTLLDKRGKLVEIPLYKVQFILQKKAELLKPTLIRLMHEGRIEEAKKRLDSLLNVLLTLAKKGIQDEDGALIRNNNIGFLNDRAIILDPGKFKQFKQPLSRKEFIYNLRRLRPLAKWLRKHYPELSAHFEEERERVVEQVSA
jgi:hypothetical protein